MKGFYNKVSALSVGCAVWFLLLLPSCATYKTKTADIETNLFDGDFKTAVANIDQNKFLLKDRNRLLFLLEKGKVEHLNGHYEKSNEYFEQAYILIDDKISTNVGQAVASKLTNPMAEPYKGEDFEKVTIHYYKALNYFQLGMPNEALVEAKRINIKLNALNDKYANNKNKYSADAFSHIVQGILYEATGDVNNAFIAYRNAAELYFAENDQYFGVPLPEQLKLDLVRTARALGFNEELREYQTKFGIAPPVKEKSPVKPAKPAKTTTTKKGAKTTKPVAAPPPPSEPPKPVGEAIVFWENGLGPVKGQTKITASGMAGGTVGTYSNEEDDIIIPVPVGVNIGLNAIAIPKYLPRESYYKRASVVVNGKEQFFDLSQDFYAIAKQCLKDRMMREAIDIALRFATKKAASKGLSMLAGELFGSVAGDVTSLVADAANVATEKADTRNWQTLPATISYVRIPLMEGENKFVIRKYGADAVDQDTLRITGKRGLQVLSYFDLGRTVGTTASQAVQPVVAAAALPGTITISGDPTGDVSIPDAAAAGIYNEWIDTGEGIFYKVTYVLKTVKKQDYYYKTVMFKNDGVINANLKYTLNEIPAAKKPVVYSVKLKAQKEMAGATFYHTSLEYNFEIIERK